jgi:hypothetical protein
MGRKFEQDRVEDRIKKAGKRTYHNENFKGDNKVKNERAPKERFPRIHITSLKRKMVVAEQRRGD